MRTWEKLDEEQRHHLQAAVDGSVPIMRELWDARVEESRRRVLEDGIELVEEIDREAFAARMRPMWDRFLTTPSLRALADQIEAINVPDTPAGARTAGDANERGLARNAGSYRTGTAPAGARTAGNASWLTRAKEPNNG
jgi:hypothetical protein